MTQGISQRYTGEQCTPRQHRFVRETKIKNRRRTVLVPVGVGKPDPTDFCRICGAIRVDVEAQAAEKKATPRVKVSKIITCPYCGKRHMKSSTSAIVHMRLAVKEGLIKEQTV